MFSSCIRHPKRDRFIKIYAWQLEACRGNACAATLLSFFERWHNWRLNQKEYTATFNQVLKEAGKDFIVDASGWQFHTDIQLVRAVLIYKRDAITAAIKLLEEIGFIETEAPKHLVKLYKTGRTKWFLLRADRLNRFCDEYNARLWGGNGATDAATDAVVDETLPTETGGAMTPRQNAGGRKPSETPEEILQKAGDKVASVINEVFAYWQRVTGRNRSKLDKKRAAAIRDRIKLDKFDLVDLCQAVEGNFVSTWHQDGAENGRGKKFDDIELICRDAKHVEDFISDAEGAGITQDDVRVRLTKKNATQARQTQKTNPFVKTDKPDLNAGKAIARKCAEMILEKEDFQNIANEFARRYKADVVLDFEDVRKRMRSYVEGEAGILNKKNAELIDKIVNTFKEQGK